MANKTKMNLLEITPTINTAEYAVGDCLFVSTEIANFFPDANSTADAADAVVDDVQCIIPVVAADFLGGANFTDTCSIACITDPSNDGIGCIVSGNGSTSLYICAILAAGAETFAVGDLTFKIGVKYL